jgi:hypothetical protein
MDDNVYFQRGKAWELAAEEHLYPKRGSIAALALGVRAWRYLERTTPGWRERDTTECPKSLRLEEIKGFFEFKKQQKLAFGFEEQYKKAFLAGGSEAHLFTRRLSEAFKIPEEEISSSVTLAGSILLAWDAINFQRLCEADQRSYNRPPTKAEIRSLIESRMKELGLTLIAERSWQRIWQDPFISALMRCA